VESVRNTSLYRVVAAALLGLAGGWSAAATPAGTDTRPAAIVGDWIDLDGRVHRLGENDSGAVRVIVFVSTTCPIANAAVPRVDELAGKFRTAAQRPVEFFGVISERGVSRADAARHFALRRLSFPVLFDATGLIAEQLAPTHVPEAFVIDPAGAVAYRGAIDDAFETVGRRRATITRQFLGEAVAAVAAGGRPGIAFVPPVGCRRAMPAAARADATVTYARDIAPIIHTRCMTCHRLGEVAPFPLTTAAEVAAHAPMIVEVTAAGTMPPWSPRPHGQPRFVGERWLSPREIELIAAWAAGGCTVGDEADLPPPPRFAAGWQLGTPDMVVRMPQAFTVPADGPDIRQNFVIPLDLPADKLVAAVEFHPGSRRVVHHAVLFLDESGAARRLDDATPEPGYANFGGPGFLPSGALGGWSAGNTPRRLPGGRGRYLKKGSDLVVQVHYHPDGLAQTDQSEIGLFFVDEPVEKVLADRQRLVGSIWTASYQIDIPAGAARHPVRASYRLPREVTVVGVVPHMHLLGRSVVVRADLPDGSSRPLIDVPAWHYAWQDEYYFERPFTLPAGTAVVVEAVFDNSDQNPANPSSPPRRVTWGEDTLDEMLFCFLLVSADRTEDLVHVILDNLGHDIRQPRDTR